MRYYELLALLGHLHICLLIKQCFIFKKHKNGVRLVMVDKYLFWIYKGAIIMKIKWSSPDHVSAIEINLGENDKFVANFHVFWFFRKRNNIYGLKLTRYWKYYHQVLFVPNFMKMGLKLSEQCGIGIKLIFPIFVDFVIL